MSYHVQSPYLQDILAIVCCMILSVLNYSSHMQKVVTTQQKDYNSLIMINRKYKDGKKKQHFSADQWLIT